MKAWKLLIAPLAFLLVVCLQINALAGPQPVTAGFGSGQNPHVTVNEDVDVAGATNAVYVQAYAPAEVQDKSASAKINGNVTIVNTNPISGVYAEGRNGDATIEVTGNVNAKSNDTARGIETWGHAYDGGGKAIIKVKGNVVAESMTYATGIDSYYGTVDVKGNVTANNTSDGYSSCGISAYYDDSIKVGGDVTAVSPSYTTGVDAWTDRITTINVAGGVFATGKDAAGLYLETFENDDNQNSELYVTVGKGVTATSPSTNEEDYNQSPSRAIMFCNQGDLLKADITGDVVAKSKLGNAVGIITAHNEELEGPFSTGTSQILVHGNVISDGAGVALDTLGENTNVDILVEEEIKAKKIGVFVRESEYAEPHANGQTKLTVWKIQKNKDGNVAETISGAAEDFEKEINYIIKVDQPSAGGTINIVGDNGAALRTEHGFAVAHEGDKLIVKPNLDANTVIAAAYNGTQALAKDSDGNYFLTVPKGGGVDLHFEIKNIRKQDEPKVSPVKKADSEIGLEKGVSVNGQKLKIILQDPYKVLPEGVQLRVRYIEPGTARYNELLAQLDDTHKVENLMFFEIELYNAKGEKISGEIAGKVRLLMQIPDGWDKKDLEAVLVMSHADIEFEESVVTIDGVDYLAFWTDHFSPYGIIDTMSDADGKSPATGDQSFKRISLFSIVSIFLAFFAFVVFKRKEENDIA